MGFDNKNEADNFFDKIGNAIKNMYDYKGVVIDYKGEIIDFDKDDVEISVKINEFNNHMVVYVIAKMFSEGKIAFKGDFEKDIQYLKKLLKENKDE